MVGNKQLITLVPSQALVDQFIEKTLYSGIIHDIISLVALQNPMAVSTSQIVYFIICSNTNFFPILIYFLLQKNQGKLLNRNL